MINQLESKVRSDCIVTKIDKDGCKLTLAKVMPIHLIIDLDKPNAPVSPSSTKICDILFFSEKGLGELRQEEPWHTHWAIPIELKSGGASITTVYEQLLGGSKAIDKILPTNCQFSFRPILALGGDMPRKQYSDLRRKRINFRGGKFQIKRVRCNSALCDALRGTP